MTYIWGNTPWSADVTPESPGYVAGNSNTHHVFTPAIAPPGYIFRPRTISLSTMQGGEAHYMIEHLINVPPHVGHHYHSIARGTAIGTPALQLSPADAAALILLPGEKLAGRALGPQPMSIMLLWSGWLLPESELEGLIRGGTTSTGGSIDLSAAVAAAQELSTALTSAATKSSTFANSIP
jgi:hypothetical protein